jgi:predicted transglutaminase-like cysteine proteinase
MRVALSQTAHGRLDDLRTGRLVAGPAGWLNWCMVDLGRCANARHAVTLTTTPLLLELLARVQREVNASIEPQPEPPGRDLWRADAAAGDCEDYALAKRARLQAAGLPAGAMRLATAILPRGELHAVLTVETDRGTLVLDNLRRDVTALRTLDYAWQRVEDTQDSLAWQELASPAPEPPDRRATRDPTASLDWTRPQ